MDDIGDLEELPDLETGEEGDEAGDGLEGLEDLSLLAETQNALQQFSIVVGVCLMVGILFFCMIAVEKVYDWTISLIKSVVCGTKRGSDPEDPASLVGSFKRYKN